MSAIVALIAGGLFGLGLVVSDMIDPARVQAFLNVTGGAWDPTLAFVMAGALVPMLLAWRRAKAPAKPALGGTYPAPVGAIDRKLIVGALLFGVGWGLVGLCPGPALAAILVGGQSVWIFVAAMFAGFAIAGLMKRP